MTAVTTITNPSTETGITVNDAKIAINSAVKGYINHAELPENEAKTILDALNGEPTDFQISNATTISIAQQLTTSNTAETLTGYYEALRHTRKQIKRQTDKGHPADQRLLNAQSNLDIVLLSAIGLAVTSPK